MSQKNNKQNKTNKKKLSNKQKRTFGIIGFTCLIVLLIFILIIFLSINTKKSDSKKLYEQFNEYYSSNTEKVVLYFDSEDDKQVENNIEISYLNQLSRDYNFKYLKLDLSKLSKEKKNEIDSKLGIKKYPSVAVLKNKKVVAINEGFIESHNLTNLLISVNILPKDGKYKYISNIIFIDYNKYKKIIDKKDTNIIVIGQAGCQYCYAVKPILNNISRAYDVDVNYLDVSDLSKNDLKELFDKLPSLGYNDKSLTTNDTFSMPTILLTKKGKIIKYIQGEKTLEEYIKLFKEYNVIE